MKSNAEGSASVRIIKYFMKKRVMKNPKLIQFHQTCDCCGKLRSESMIPMLINTLSNVCMKKLSTCLNRKTSISKITLSMVKEIVKNNNKHKFSNNTRQTNSGNWTIRQCKEFLNKHDAPLGGTVEDLRDRCILAIKLEEKKLNGVWKYGIAKLRDICSEMTISMCGKKTDLLKNIGAVILDPNHNLDELTLLQELREEEEEMVVSSNINETVSSC